MKRGRGVKRWLRELAHTLAVIIGAAFLAVAVVIGEPEHEEETDG